LKSGRYFPPRDLFSKKKSNGPGPRGRRSSSPSWTEVAQTRGHGGALPARGAQALGLTGARQRWWRRMSQTRRCQRGAHQSTSGGKEQWWLELSTRAMEGARELER
jgi:hypothetical protein